MNFLRFPTAASAALITLGAAAIPADPEPKQVTLPDGTVTTVQMCGDEYGHALYDASGQRVEFDSNGFLRKIDPAAPLTGMTRPAIPQGGMRRGAPVGLKAGNYPTVGKVRNLAVIVEFSDVKFSSMPDPYDYFHRMLNEEGFTWSNGANGSARDFYIASSDGKFLPEFDVVGPVTLSREASYYGKDEGTQDSRMGEFLKEVLDKIDPEVNFADYDTDGDGFIDNIYFFYAGYGQADHPKGTDFIWPHSADAMVAWELNLEYDGKKFNHYATSNEIRYSASGDNQPTGVGTFVHEFGHVLGLMDHYDTAYNMFSFGLGSMDTMASGSYNNNMHTPPLFSGYERAVLGWMDYTDVEDPTDGIIDLPWIGNGQAQALRVKVSGKDSEWFVLENRQQSGWDAYLPAHGLLIWHIDEVEERWDNNTVNTDSSHQLIDIIEVDGIGSDASRGGDTMPGTAGVTSLTLTSWDNNGILHLDDVEEILSEDPAANLVRVLTGGSKFRLAMPAAPEVSDLLDDSFSFNWKPIENAAYYLVSVTDGSNPVNGLDNRRMDTPEKITLTGLSPETTYTLSITAGRGTFLSTPVTCPVTTPVLAFHKRELANLAVTDATADGFSASWDALDDATSYEISLSRIEREESGHDEGYDFSGKNEGMPTLWESTSTSFYSTDGFFGESAPSLRMIKNGDYLVIAWPESLIYKLGFWYSDNGAGNSFVVEYAEGSDWKELGQFDAVKGGATAEVTDIPGAERVRIRLDRKGGYATIDDITTAVRSLQRIADARWDGFTTAGTALTFTNLQGGLYGLRVTAVNADGTRARISGEKQIVVDPAGISTVDADAVPVAYYGIDGIRRAAPANGINIVVYSDDSRHKEFFRN